MSEQNTPNDDIVPPELEARVVRSLEQRGLLTAQRPRSSAPVRWRGAALLAAAAVLCVFALTRTPQWQEWRTRGAEPTEEPRFALLLYDAQQTTGADQHVEEVRQWARAIRGRGHFVTGEKLGGLSAHVSATAEAGWASGNDPELAGFFVIGARDLQDAIGMARTSPVVRHGGRIVVRPIEPT
jgi:hypothetical protein